MAEERKITKRDLVLCWLRWLCFAQANMNYERLITTGISFSLAPVFKKLYGDDPEEMKKCLQRHNVFFNTEAHYGACIIGMIAAMEEQRANGKPLSDEMINSIKTSLMGPFAGIGDTLWQGTQVPILTAIGVSIAAGGNILGPLLFVILNVGLLWVISYNSFKIGYQSGREGVAKMISGGRMQQIIQGASTVGAITIGALAAQYVKLSTPLVLKIGEYELALQSGVFDRLVQGLLPLALLLVVLHLLRKNMKALTVIGILALACIVLGAVSIV
jgi:PTS system mannose-specific IID component